jgi:Tfp pilus assembly protein PilP
MSTLLQPFGALAIGLAIAAASAAPAESQGATTTPTPPVVEAKAPSAPLTAVSEGYTYRPEGRRDPFVSLVGRGVEGVGRKGDGLQGLGTAEISVRGVMQSRSGYVAIVQGPDQKTHLVRQNDRLSDGIVKSITPQGLVILQEVNDPLSLVQQREVRKGLPGSEGK